MKPDAKLGHQISQKLRLSWGIGVFTISSGGRGVSVYLTSFYASGPPVVKLDPILFGVSCRDNLFKAYIYIERYELVWGAGSSKEFLVFTFLFCPASPESLLFLAEVCLFAY